MTIPDDIFKAYDVRGLYPQELDEDAAERIGCALAQQLGAARLGTGMDPRPSSTGLLEAFAAGAAAAGASTVDFGLVPTEMLYFGVASKELDGGVMITASHNPPQYNGMKLVGAGALPLSGDQGIPELKQRSQALAELPARAAAAGYERLDLYPAYVAHLRALVDTAAFRPHRVVMDAANGVAGKLAPQVFDGTPIDRVPMYFEVDGTFPNHAPNPLLEENSREIRERVVAEKADLGIAWDGDADRCFFIDEHGEFVPGDFVTALLAETMLSREPGGTVLYDVRASWAVPRTIEAAGGTALVNRVGHAFIKHRMRKEDAVFAGEVSAHYYFRDFTQADSGVVPFLLMLELISRRGTKLSEILTPFREHYFITGEINTPVADVALKLQEIKERYAAQGGRISHLDGVSVDFDDWHFNVRPSNTEPLLRLNLEALSEETMIEKRDEVLDLIRSS
jgi:phosphomannomutase